MLIINFPYKGITKIPGSELGCVSFIKEIIIEKNEYFKDNKFLDMSNYEKEGCKKIRKVINENIKLKNNILIWGGDHATTSFIYSHILENPIKNIIIFDAHNDYDSNNIAKEDRLYNWNVINTLEDYIDIGIVLGFRDKKYTMKESSKFRYIEDIDFYNFEKIKNILKGYCQERESIYVSLDLDVLNPAEFPGVGFKVAGGISLRELIICLRIILKYSKQVVIDIVEFNPLIEKKDSIYILKRIFKEITSEY